MFSGFLSEFAIVIVAAFVGGFVARSLRFPPVLGYIASGILFGILGKNFFHSYNSLVDLSQIGVSLLLFTLGFEISLDSIKNLSKKIILIGALQIVLTSLIFFPIFFIFGFSYQVCIIFSILFSFSSTAVVVKILEEKGLLNDFPGNNIFILLLVQDLFVIPVIFLLPILFSNTSVSFPQVGNFLISAAAPLIIFITILILSKFFLSRFLNILFRYPSHELTILATVFVAIVSIGLFQAVGIPQSIAAFLAGVLISEEGKNLTPLSEIRPFRDLFLVLFFVVTGMLLNFSFFLSHIWVILVLSILVVSTKLLVTYIILRFNRYSPSSSVAISSYLANVGEFAVVIGQIAFLSHLIKFEDYNYLLSIFILTLLSLPFLTDYLRKNIEKLSKLGLLKGIVGTNGHFYKGFTNESIENHVVICGHGRMGKQVRALLEMAEIPYIVVDFNRKIINELLNTSKFAIYGDPTDDEILKSAHIETAKVLVIALPDTFSQKKIIKQALLLNPRISILCRSHIEEDKYDLINMGVNSIIIPEFEAGLRMGGEVLEIFGLGVEEANSLVRKSRRTHLMQ